MYEKATTISIGTPSRHDIDVAIGVLIGLRRCSERQAFSAIAAAVSETGLSLGAVCRGLVELAGEHGEAFDRTPEMSRLWHELVGDRSRSTEPV